MKAYACLLMLACLSLTAQAENSGKLEVHEWGTFTVLSGSDGTPLNWYQGPAFLDELPPFVQFTPTSLKGAPSPGAIVRMETPVIYFYPGQAALERDKPLRVTVSARFDGGQLTEWFPSPKRPATSMIPFEPITWEGDLLPPSDKEALSQIPEVPPGSGDHYRHAREVPGAWIFRSTTPAFQPTALSKGKDADKFIFYRGKGQTAPPYRVKATNESSVSLMHWGAGEAITAAFGLSVKDGAAQWTRMPELAATTDDTATHSAEVSVRFQTTAVPVEKAAEELASAVRQTLVAAGLSGDEARAMVATWNGHWFREPGTRVLAIVPQKWVDAVLPLTITPSPSKVSRVFVARFEALTPQNESTLLTLLNGSSDGKAEAVSFRKLQLGRFAQGALLRAQQMHAQRMTEQFWKLQQVVATSPPG